MKPEISIILPTKEEENAFEVIKDLRRIFPKGLEIVVVDKSGDAYYNKLRKTGVKVVRQKSRGVENGLIEGFAQATGNILATVDADGTHQLIGIKKGMEIVKKGESDLVLGNRMDNIQEGAMSPYLKLGNWGLSCIYDVLYRKQIHDILTGMQIMSREAYEKVKEIRIFEMPIAFFQIEIARQGYRVSEVPIEYYKRSAGESKLAKSKFMYGLKTANQMIKRAKLV